MYSVTTSTSGVAPASLAIPADVQDLLFLEAHTIQTFTDQPVTAEEISAVWDLVKWGPTAMNTGPLRLMLVQDPAARARLVEHLGENNKQKTLVAPLTIVAAFDPNFHLEMPRLAPHMAGVKEMFDPQEGMRQGMARDNAWLQAGYLIVGLRAAGLHVGPMTGFDALGTDGEFFMENGWHSFLVLNVGHEAAERDDVPQPVVFPRQMRLPFEDMSVTV